MAPKGKKKSNENPTEKVIATTDGSSVATSAPVATNGTGPAAKKVTEGNPVPKVEQTPPAEPPSAPQPSGAKPPSAAQVPAADPLQSLQSLWTSLPWGAPTPPSATSAQARANTGTSTTASNPEWLSGAQNMWNDAFQGANAAVAGAVEGANAAVAGAVENANAAMAQAGEAVQKIDKSVLEGGLANLRDASDKLVRDVKEGVAALSEDAKKVSEEASSIGNNTSSNINLNINGSELLENLKTSTKEALEIFTDKKEEPSISPKDIPAPWDPQNLPEKERKYAGKLRERMLKLVVDAIYSRVKRETLFLTVDIGDFNFDIDINLPKALSVLEVDPNVRRLRAGLVPGKMKENEFWNIYFWHVRHTRRLLVANKGTLPSDAENKEEEEELFLDKGGKSSAVGSTNANEGEVKREDGPKTPGSATTNDEGQKDWDKEIDEIFDS